MMWALINIKKESLVVNLLQKCFEFDRTRELIAGIQGLSRTGSPSALIFSLCAISHDSFTRDNSGASGCKDGRAIPYNKTP